MLNFCTQFENVDDKRQEISEMSSFSFIQYLEKLHQKLVLKSKVISLQGNEIATGQSQEQITHGSDRDLTFSKIQLVELNYMLANLRKNNVRFNQKELRVTLKKLNLLREFDEIIMEEQKEYDHLVNDLQSVNNFIVSSRYNDRDPTLHEGPLSRVNTRKSLGFTTNRALSRFNLDPKTDEKNGELGKPVETKAWSTLKRGLKRTGSAYQLGKAELRSDFDYDPRENRLLNNSCFPKFEDFDQRVLFKSQITIEVALDKKEKPQSKNITSLWLYVDKLSQQER